MKVHFVGRKNMKRNQMMIVFIPTLVYMTECGAACISIVWLFFELEFEWNRKK